MPPVLETAVLTVLALLAFASNSILTRLALGARVIDAASFTAVRLGAGALVLAVLVRVRAGGLAPLRRQNWLGPVALFVYAAPFSFAYLRIGAAVGALVLFGTVQLTMIGWAVVKGERPTARTWAGLVLAAGGLAWLVAPAASRPDPLGVALMVTAGVAWAVYSLAGRGSPDLLIANARNFVWSVPMAALLVGVAIKALSVSARGLTLAAISGAVTSGLGYAIWYRALRGLTATQAAVVQLSVPVIAAFGAVGFLGEPVSGRLVLAGVAVLGGVALVLSRRPAQRL